MPERKILIPNEGHPISISPNPSRIIIRVGGKVIADTRDALELKEAAYPPVQYIPREDVDMSQLAQSSHTTYCPYKGDAGYFDLSPLGENGAQAVWTYENPYPAVEQIAGRLAFYPNKVTISVEP
jgi:uncharacterized protein (DUF427 family)